MSLIAAIATTEGQPDAAFDALGRLAMEVSGARLVTAMTFDAVAREACRRWTSDPANYPASGTKPVQDTIWTATVLDQHKTFVANDIEAIAEVFFDHELILSLGCESCMNLPVIANGKVLGTINMLDGPGYFTPPRVAEIEAKLALPGLATFLFHDTLSGDAT